MDYNIEDILNSTIQMMASSNMKNREEYEKNMEFLTQKHGKLLEIHYKMNLKKDPTQANFEALFLGTVIDEVMYKMGKNADNFLPINKEQGTFLTVTYPKDESYLISVLLIDKESFEQKPLTIINLRGFPTTRKGMNEYRHLITQVE